MKVLFCFPRIKIRKKNSPGTNLSYFLNSGAGNEARTRDINLGKVALYQLSYSRVRIIILMMKIKKAILLLTFFLNYSFIF